MRKIKNIKPEIIVSYLLRDNKYSLNVQQKKYLQNLFNMTSPAMRREVSEILHNKCISGELTMDEIFKAYLKEGKKHGYGIIFYKREFLMPLKRKDFDVQISNLELFMPVFNYLKNDYSKKITHKIENKKDIDKNLSKLKEEQDSLVKIISTLRSDELSDFLFEEVKNNYDPVFGTCFVYAIKNQKLHKPRNILIDLESIKKLHDNYKYLLFNFEDLWYSMAFSRTNTIDSVLEKKGLFLENTLIFKCSLEKIFIFLSTNYNYLNNLNLKSKFPNFISEYKVLKKEYELKVEFKNINIVDLIKLSLGDKRTYKTLIPRDYLYNSFNSLSKAIAKRIKDYYAIENNPLKNNFEENYDKRVVVMNGLNQSILKNNYILYRDLNLLYNYTFANEDLGTSRDLLNIEQLNKEDLHIPMGKKLNRNVGKKEIVDFINKFMPEKIKEYNDSDKEKLCLTKEDWDILELNLGT
jgi:hypothetical protein